MRKTSTQFDISALPSIRGAYREDAPLGAESWFRAGGNAQILFEPADAEDLAHFLKDCPPEIPRMVVGAASNILVRDGGIEGVVIRLGKAFEAIKVEGEHIRAGAYARCASISREAARASLGGFAFMQGIPGSVGGALRMNAGAYGSDIQRIYREAKALDRKGKTIRLSPEDMGFRYRRAAAGSEMIFLEGLFQGEKTSSESIAREASALRDARRTSQPPGARTGGSAFKNPGGASANGVKAWRLIRDAGCADLAVGGAHVSPLHCNFLVNSGSATAADIENLGKEIQRRVKDHCGVSLEWEIRIVGEAL